MADKTKPEDSPAFYKSLFENMLDGLAYGQMIFDEQGNPVDYIYLQVNKNVEKLLGVKDIAGKRVTEVIPGIEASNPGWIETHGRVALTGKPERFETYIKPLSVWLSISLFSTKKTFFVSIFQNITNQKRIEKNLEDARIAAQNVLEDLSVEKSRYEDLAKDLEKFKLALDSASDNVIITDPEGIVIYVNKSVEAVTGYRPEEAIGKKSGALWKAPMPLAYYQKMWETIKTQKKVFTSEIQNKRKNGSIYTAEISISPIINKDGEVEFFVSIERDITKEKEIDQAKDEFMSLASHQLRTPPSIIGWYAETLQSGDLGPMNEKQAEYVSEIYKANQRMVATINSLLNISRIEMGTFSITPKEIDVKSIIDETLKELMSRFHRGAEVKKDYDPNMGSFNADPEIMAIIVDNLLSNAFKYSPSNNVKIDIAIKKENDFLVLSVKDYGIVIPPKDQNKIFIKLFRADNAVTASPDGTGLGLYMIKKIIVDGLGGKIWFDSEENKGTTFYVSFPVSGMKEKSGTSKLIWTSSSPPVL
jgi:PAS domain S-box-containing protein